MKVTYLRLENVAGLMVGSNLSKIEIDFTNSTNRIVAIVAKNSSGKALLNSAKIPTPDGHKLMGDIVPGDEIFGSDGEVYHVLGKFPQGVKKIYKVTFSDGRVTKCCGEHLWAVYDNGRQYVLPLKDLINDYKEEVKFSNHVAYKYRYSIPLLTAPVQYKHRDVPVDPYTLGAFIARGFYKEKRLCVEGSNTVIRNICENNNYKSVFDSKKWRYYFRIEDRHIYVEAKDYFEDIKGFLKEEEFSRRIPEEYIYNDVRTRIAFLRGLFDAGSCLRVGVDHYRIHFTSKSLDLINQLQYMLWGLGYLVKTYLQLDDESGDYYGELVVDAETQQKIAKLYSDIKYKEQLFHSESKYTIFSENTSLNIVDIEEIGEEEASCIMVDSPDHLYLAEDFIVTHNSTLLSAIQPFGSVGTLDDRSSLPFIIVGKNGYKEIHYTKGSDEYVIKHFYKASKDSHMVKSYFMKNGEELNENGNVTSFNALVETHFGLTMEMMRLIRIGTNVNSFISLLPARRKEYIGKLIEEIDLYIQIYKKINDDIKIVKAMMQANATSLRNCHVSDIEVEKDNLSALNKDIKEREKERDGLIADLSRVTALIENNDINKLRNQRNDAMASLNEYNAAKRNIENNNLEDKDIDTLIAERNKLSEVKVSVQSKINSYRLAIDQLSTQIERLELNAKKISSDNDMNSLNVAIDKLRTSMNNTPKIIKSFVIVETSESVYSMMLKLQSLNQVSKVIISFGEKPISVYKKLVDENQSVEKWLARQIKAKESSISRDDLMSLIRMVFAEDDIISPNCDTEFKECPYYRLYDVIKEADSKLSDEVYDSETLNHIKILSENMSLVFNAVDMIQTSNLPDKIKDAISYKSALKRLSDKLPFFDLTDMEEYLGIVKEAEIYKANAIALQEYEYRLMMYKKSGVDSILEEIKQHKAEIATYNENIRNESATIQSLNGELSKVDSYITLVGKYNDLKKYKKTFESTLENVNKLLEPLETAAAEKRELEFKVTQMRSVVDSLRNQHRLLESKINNYNRLVDDGVVLDKKNRDLSMILDAVSTKKGIPVYYMRKYLVKIQKLTNDLLDLIYKGEFQLAPFIVTPEEFKIPYTKNGKTIEDIKYSSQSEISMTAMALSFSLATNSSMDYNIILADEVDGGLDESNRLSFLKMLYKQMDVINAEQVFIISQNLSQMTTIPMDCIMLSDVAVKSSLQNIIWEKP